MASKISEETTEVIIVGAGPSGLTLAASLASHGIKSIVLEKSATIWPYPRAFRISDEGLRVLQSVGLLKETYEKITDCESLQAAIVRVSDGLGQRTRILLNLSLAPKKTSPRRHSSKSIPTASGAMGTTQASLFDSQSWRRSCTIWSTRAARPKYV
jgi:thioredoxin reductase